MNNAFIKDFKLTKSTIDNINKVIELMETHETRFHVDGTRGGMIIGKGGMFYFDSEVEKKGYDYGIIIFSVDEYDRRYDEKQFVISNGELWDVDSDGSKVYKNFPIDEPGFNGWFWLTFPRDFSSTVKEYIGQLLRELTGC